MPACPWGRSTRPAAALGEIWRTFWLPAGRHAPGGSGRRRPLWRLPAAVLLHLPLPEEMPPAESFLPLLPPGLRAFALYVQAHYLYLKEDYANSAGMVEGALAMGASAYPIPAIYLHLVAVMDYMSLKADGTGPDPSADRLGDRPAGRSHRGLRGAPRPAGGHAGGGHQARLAGGF